MYTNNNQPPFGGSTSGLGSKPFGTKPFAATGKKTDFEGGVDGLRWFPPHDNAPDFIKGTIKMERDQLMEWLAKQKDTVRVDLKESKEGKLYLQVNTFEPKK